MTQAHANSWIDKQTRILFDDNSDLRCISMPNPLHTPARPGSIKAFEFYSGVSESLLSKLLSFDSSLLTYCILPFDFGSHKECKCNSCVRRNAIAQAKNQSLKENILLANHVRCHTCSLKPENLSSSLNRDQVSQDCILGTVKSDRRFDIRYDDTREALLGFYSLQVDSQLNFGPHCQELHHKVDETV